MKKFHFSNILVALIVVSIGAYMGLGIEISIKKIHNAESVVLFTLSVLYATYLDESKSKTN